MSRGCRLIIIAVTVSGGWVWGAVLTNPGFETGDLTGWTTFGDNGNIHVESVSPQEGTYALKLYQQFTGTTNYSGVYQNLPCIPGATYRLSGYLRNGYPSTDYLQTNNRAFLKLEWYDASGTMLGFVENYDPPSQGLDWNTPQDDTWRFNSFDATAPAGAVTVRVVLIHAYQGSGYEGGSSWFDNLNFGAVPEPGIWVGMVVGATMLATARAVGRRRT